MWCILNICCHTCPQSWGVGTFQRTSLCGKLDFRCFRAPDVRLSALIWEVSDFLMLGWKSSGVSDWSLELVKIPTLWVSSVEVFYLHCCHLQVLLVCGSFCPVTFGFSNWEAALLGWDQALSATICFSSAVLKVFLMSLLTSSFSLFMNVPNDSQSQFEICLFSAEWCLQNLPIQFYQLHFKWKLRSHIVSSQILCGVELMLKDQRCVCMAWTSHLHPWLSVWEELLEVSYPHGFLDVVLPDHLCRPVHVPLQAADQLSETLQIKITINMNNKSSNSQVKELK